MVSQVPRASVWPPVKADQDQLKKQLRKPTRRCTSNLSTQPRKTCKTAWQHGGDDGQWSAQVSQPSPFVLCTAQRSDFPVHVVSKTEPRLHSHLVTASQGKTLPSSVGAASLQDSVGCPPLTYRTPRRAIRGTTTAWASAPGPEHYQQERNEQGEDAQQLWREEQAQCSAYRPIPWPTFPMLLTPEQTLKGQGP